MEDSIEEPIVREGGQESAKREVELSAEVKKENSISIEP